MRIVSYYSHLNGLEFLQVHKPNLWTEIQSVIFSVNAKVCKTKISKERNMKGRALYSPIEMNKLMKIGFKKKAWTEKRSAYWVTGDAQLIRKTMHLPIKRQKEEIEAAGGTPIYSYNQTDFVKDRVAVEVQFGKYPFVAFDLFVKHMAFFVSNIIDVGVEILPMKELQAHMSSGPSYFEGELYNLIREGRGVPAVPLILVGVAP